MKSTLILAFSFVLFGCQISDKEVPKDFSFCIDIGFFDKYCSKDSTFKRPYISGDTILKIWFTKEETEKIYNTILENNFLDLPTDIPLDDTKDCIIPSEKNRITVYIGKHTTHYKFSRACPPLNRDLAKRFDNVYNLIISLITKKDEYKKLPHTDIFVM